MNALILIAAFAAVGLWLEGINGKRDLFDELLTPLPLGLLGCAVALVEHGA